MAGMDSNKQAARMRDALKSIADSRINALRPDIRVGTVFSADRESQTAFILFPGNDEKNLVPVRFGLDKIPTVTMDMTFDTDGLNAIGDIVRIAGKPGSYFILDFIQGSPMSAAIDLAKLEINVKWEEEVIPVPTNVESIFHDLKHVPLDLSETLHWNELYQPATEWKRNLKTVQLFDEEGFLEVGDKLTFRYMYEDVGFEPVIVYDTMPIIGSASYDNLPRPASCPLPVGTQPGDLVIIAVSSGRNGGVVNSPDTRFVGKVMNAGYGATFFAIMGEDLSPFIVNTYPFLTSGNSNCTVAMSTYRGVIPESAVIFDYPVNPGYSAPDLNGEFAVCAVTAVNGSFTAGTSIALTSGSEEGWAKRTGANDYKASTAIFDWFSKEGPKDIDEATFTFNGSNALYGVCTYKLRPKP